MYDWVICRCYVSPNDCCITFRYDQPEFHPSHSPCPCSCYHVHALLSRKMRSFTNLRENWEWKLLTTINFCTGRGWDLWTGFELKLWRREQLSPAQGFQSMAPDNLTVFHLKRFNIPDMSGIYVRYLSICKIKTSVFQNLWGGLPAPTKFARSTTFSWISQQELTMYRPFRRQKSHSYLISLKDGKSV